MNMLDIRRLGVALAAAAAALAPAAASSQSYPMKPIEMVIHTGPGAGQDVIGRLIADISSREKYLAGHMAEMGEFMVAVGIKKP